MALKPVLALGALCLWVTSMGFARTASAVTVSFDESDVNAWSGGADIEPRGLEALSDGRLVYFEDSSTLPSAKQDAILLFDPSANGVNRFSVIASEAQMRALAPTNNYNITVSDLVRDDANNIYALATEYSENKSVQDNFVVKIPYSNNGFGAPVLTIDVPDGGLSATATARHRLTVSNPSSTNHSVSLEVVSARANVIGLALAGSSFVLAPNQSRTVHFTVHLNPNAPYGVGDAVLVRADYGSGLQTDSLFTIENPN